MPELLLGDNAIGSIKGVIFDKDGTLSNSEYYLYQIAKTRIEFSVRKFIDLRINNIKILILRKLLFTLYGLKSHGISASAIMAIASREQNIISTATIFSLFGFNWSKSIEMSQQIFEEVDLSLSKNKTFSECRKPLTSGAFDFLISLKKKGVNLALMTNDTKNGVEEFISVNKLQGFFHYLWSAECQPSKPNPKAVIELCKRINLKPAECALISDADTDLKMAKKAKLPLVIGYVGGWINPPILEENQFLLRNWDELKVQ